VLHFLLPIMQIIPSSYSGGGLMILLGIAVVLWAAWLFNRAGTAIKPFEESTQMIVSGPYRWSRNPIYLGLVFILFGIGLALGTLSPFLVIPVFVWIIQKRFISHEEAMLEKRFCAAYAEYKKRIRRWL